MISVYGVANIFIAIIEDSYWAVKGARSPSQNFSQNFLKNKDDLHVADDKDKKKKEKKDEFSDQVDSKLSNSSNNNSNLNKMKPGMESENLIHLEEEAEPATSGEHEGGLKEREKELQKLWQRLLDLHVEELKDIDPSTQKGSASTILRKDTMRNSKEFDPNNNNNKTVSRVPSETEVEKDIESIVEELFEKQKAKLGKQLKKKLSEALVTRKRT
jgi:hypothetical protein